MLNPAWAEDYNPPPGHTRSLLAPYIVVNPPVLVVERNCADGEHQGRKWTRRLLFHLFGSERDFVRVSWEPLSTLSWFGAGAVLLCGASVGDGAVVGAETVVDFNVPAFTNVAGNLPRFVGSVPRVAPAD